MRDYPEFFDGKEFLRRHLLPGLSSVISALTMFRLSFAGSEPFRTDYGPVTDVE